MEVGYFYKDNKNNYLEVVWSGGGLIELSDKRVYKRSLLRHIGEFIPRDKVPKSIILLYGVRKT